MRSKSKVSRRRNNRRKNASQNYGTLEARNLLATLVSLNAGTGGLEVSLTSNGDVAAIGVTEDGNVTVNGSEDLDIDTSGTQAFATSNLKTINVTGQASQSGQEVSFHDNIQVSSVSVSAIEQLTFEGTLSTTDNFIASLSGEGGQITDSTTGRLVVGHAAYFDAGSNQIRLDNSDNDFNLLRLRTEGYRQNAYITDVNDVVLIGVETSGKFIINAGGEIADAPNTRIHVTRDAYLTAESVTLGDHTSDDTNFFRTGFKVRGHVDLQEDSNIVLRSSNVGSMTLRSVGGILDGKQTRIDVAGKAQLFGNNRIRLGEGSGNTFDSGTVEFQTFGNAKITENSTLKLIGDNSAKTSVIEADGDITNSMSARLCSRRMKTLLGW